MNARFSYRLRRTCCPLGRRWKELQNRVPLRHNKVGTYRQWCAISAYTKSFWRIRLSRLWNYCAGRMAFWKRHTYKRSPQVCIGGSVSHSQRIIEGSNDDSQMIFVRMRQLWWLTANNCKCWNNKSVESFEQMPFLIISFQRSSFLICPCLRKWFLAFIRRHPNSGIVYT